MEEGRWGGRGVAMGGLADGGRATFPVEGRASSTDPAGAEGSLATLALRPPVPTAGLAGTLGTHAVLAPVQGCPVPAVLGRLLVVLIAAGGAARLLQEEQEARTDEDEGGSAAAEGSHLGARGVGGSGGNG